MIKHIFLLIFSLTLKIKANKGLFRCFKGFKGYSSNIKAFKGFKGSLGGLDLVPPCDASSFSKPFSFFRINSVICFT